MAPSPLDVRTMPSLAAGSNTISQRVLKPLAVHVLHGPQYGPQSLGDRKYIGLGGKGLAKSL